MIDKSRMVPFDRGIAHVLPIDSEQVRAADTDFFVVLLTNIGDGGTNDFTDVFNHHVTFDNGLGSEQTLERENKTREK